MPPRKSCSDAAVRVEIHEDQCLPGIHLHRDQAVVFAFKILHTIELGHAFERAVESVVPSVIRAMQDGRLSARFGDDRSCVMPADIEKRPQDAVVSAHGDDGLAGDRRGHELARLCHLIDASDHLPGLAEDDLPFQFGNTRVHIPRSGNRVRVGEMQLCRRSRPESAAMSISVFMLSSLGAESFPTRSRAAAIP